MSSKLKASNGDWVCADKRCGNVNFARRTSCNRCGKDKGKIDSVKITGSEIGKQAAAKSKGLFSAEDWMCSKCCNVNWARRNDCNMCGHPKFSKVEHRTGYGGGYNEREGVEYIKREDSDDEFDEFGRRKKSKPGAQQPASEEADNRVHPKRDTTIEPEEEEEEEEDDDDDDEGDLSKYNLDDEDEDDNEDGDLSKYNLDDSDTETKDKGRRSRSKSSSPPSKKKRRSDSSSSSSSSSRSRSGSSRSCSHSRSRSKSSSSNRSSRGSRSKSNSRSRSRSPKQSSKDSPRERSKRSRSRSRSRSH